MSPEQILAMEMVTSLVWCTCLCHDEGGINDHWGDICTQCGGEVDKAAQMPDIRMQAFICEHHCRWIDVGKELNGLKMCLVCSEPVPAMGNGYVGIAVAKASVDDDMILAGLSTLYKKWNQNRWNKRPRSYYEEKTGKVTNEEQTLEDIAKDLFG